MYTNMKMWRDIRRRVLVLKESKRSVQRHYGIHWETLQKILGNSEPPGYQRTKPIKKPKIDPVLPFIREIIKDDKTQPRKQRHTAKRIFDRLVKEQEFDGGYTIVKDAVREIRQSMKEVFVPLSHPPGEAQVDYGCAWVDLNGKRVKVALFVMSLPYSNVILVRAFHRECTESFQEGHNQCFQMLGGVPDRISYDNTKIAVSKIIGSRKRELTDGFLKLQSHYLFEEHFCLVRRPNEKGHVEHGVEFVRRNYLVPIPCVQSMMELNEYLLQCFLEDLARESRQSGRTKEELLAEEREHFLPLPKQLFPAHRLKKSQASSLSLVPFESNQYSVPTSYAYHDVQVVGTVDEVKFIVKNHLVARHARRWDKHQVIFEPIHYLALLERKPGAFDFARPLEGWQLPECFPELRRRLEGLQEGSKGTREYIKVLRLLESATLKELAVAVREALQLRITSYEAVRLILEYRREQPIAMFSLDGHPHLKSVQVQDVDLSAYSSLTSSSWLEERL